MKQLLVAKYNNSGYLVDGIHGIPLPESYLLQSVFLEGLNYSCPHSGLKTNLDEVELLFVCSDLDPNRRIKRGQFYIKDREGTQPSRPFKKVTSDRILYLRGSVDCHHIEAIRFKPYRPSRESDVHEMHVFFGDDNIKSKWRIISVEPILGNEEIYILQEVVGVGAIPFLREELIPEKYLSELKSEFAGLISELNSSPETIVDHCRDLTTSSLSAFLGLDSTGRKDLGDLILMLDKSKSLVISCAGIINRLHPRRKPNEIDKHGLLNLSMGESELAVRAVFQILKELGWVTN